MPIHLHRAERTDTLADGLAVLLATPPTDPFAEDLVLVPTRGAERWLSQRLAQVLGTGPDSTGGDGVCAAVRFRSPAALITEIAGSADSGAREDPWAPDTLAWPLLEVIDASLDEPWCRTLATHLGHFHTGAEAELRRGRRYPVARRLAGLFASYARQRPQLLIDWLDGATGDVDDDLRWQPPLWRALVRTLGIDPPHIHHQKTLTRLRDGPSDTLPARLSLFGHTRLPVTDVELLDALSTHHELHLWLPHPSDAWWRRLVGEHGAIPRSADASSLTATHPLLATLGRDLRELQRSLPPSLRTDEYLGGATPSDTLLGWLQADIAANAAQPDGRMLVATDRSVQVHACHGPARQVDVLREVLLGLLEDDPSLEPRDIAVMCPDIDTYAPLFVANFGLGDLAGHTHPAHPAHRLRVKLADRAPTQTNPLLGVVARLLALAGGRVTASEVLDLAQVPPVRYRFCFTDDDLAEITNWVQKTNIRWGFDAEHRKPYELDGIVHNTWQFGLDRILTGVAMSADAGAWLQTALPLDDVGSDQVELAGRLAEFLTRLQTTVDKLSGARPLSEWINALADGVAQLTRVHSEDAWQQNQLRREFDDVSTQAGTRAGTLLRLPDARALLSAHLAGRPTRANFRTGALTVCTMMPMRSVPHRVVCLVGLDDGAFPRLDLPDGDDVLARQPMTGERDIRSEDRQLLLDAVCAATETLVITYTGADEHTGKPHPPAVPLAELLDALDGTTPQPVRQRIVVTHPLQPFDPKNARPGALVPATAFTFDATAVVAAQVAAGARHPPRRFVSGPVSGPAGGDVALRDLVHFFKDPVSGFFRALDFALPWEVENLQDEMPVAIDARMGRTVGERMLTDMLGGMAPDTAVGAEWRRGTLPPGQLGWRTAKQIRDQSLELAAAALRHRWIKPDTYDIDVDLGAGFGGRRLTGTVSPVFGERTVSVTYSKLGGKQLIESWIRLLALKATAPDRDWGALCLGRDKNGHHVQQRLLQAPVDPHSLLADLVGIYDAGRREPLPLPVKTSYAWASARHHGGDPVRAAARCWLSQDYFHGENAEPAPQKVWGRKAPLQVLLDSPSAGEQTAGENTRMGSLAARLWLPLLRSERVTG